MINLNEVADKLSAVLNDISNSLRIDGESVLFQVATEGYRVDNIANRDVGKNAIPVYLQVTGGENQPIRYLNQQSKSFAIAVFYPIQYKEVFFGLENYLINAFVGAEINFGDMTGLCLCNIDSARYGDITGMDLQEFSKFVSSKYEKTIETSENWHSLTINLFLTKLADDYMFGNDVKYFFELNYKDINITGIRLNDSLETYYSYYSSGNRTVDDVYYYCFRSSSNNYIYCPKSMTDVVEKCDYLGSKAPLYRYDNDTQKMILYTDEQHQMLEVVISVTNTQKKIKEEVVWSSSGTGVSVSPISEQIINSSEPYSKNVPNITTYNKSILAFFKPTTPLGALLYCLYNLQRLDAVVNVKLTKQYSNGYKFRTKQMFLTVNENSELGSPLSFTLTMGDSK